MVRSKNFLRSSCSINLEHRFSSHTPDRTHTKDHPTQYTLETSKSRKQEGKTLLDNVPIAIESRLVMQDNLSSTFD